MKIIIILFFFFLGIYTYAQDFEESGACQDDNNANCNKWWTSLENSKRAVFEWGRTGNFPDPDPAHDAVFCTGTLINQNVDDPDDIEQYFITARHCFNGENLNGNFVFIFNYQSPTCGNDAVPVNNRGWVGSVYNEVRYRHVSTITEIDQVWAPDMAVFRIDNPIPPHFNVYYAGWTKAIFQATQLPHHIIHHPQGDIKKIAKTWTTVTVTNTACHTVTTVIDAIFAWLGVTINTEVICTFSESPQYAVPLLSDGALEGGSSGSALLNSNMRIIGTLAWGIPINGCFPGTFVNQFGRFNTAYLNSSAIRNALNPNDSYIITIHGNEVECYDELLNLNGDYFPAEDYQPENLITLQANTDITTNGNLTIHTGADFEFLAGESITLTQGFIAEPGSHFVAQINMPCNSVKSNKIDNLYASTSQIELPEYKEFKIENYISKPKDDLLETNISIYPNPSKGIINIDIIGNISAESFTMQIYDTFGRKIKEQKLRSLFSQVDISSYVKGMYLIVVKTENKVYLNEKVIYL